MQMWHQKPKLSGVSSNSTTLVLSTPVLVESTLFQLCHDLPSFPGLLNTTTQFENIKLNHLKKKIGEKHSYKSLLWIYQTDLGSTKNQQLMEIGWFFSPRKCRVFRLWIPKNLGSKYWGSQIWQFRCRFPNLQGWHLLCIIQFVFQDTIPEWIPSLKLSSSPLKKGGLLGDAYFRPIFRAFAATNSFREGICFILFCCFELIVYFRILEGPGQLNPTILSYVITCVVVVCSFRCSYLLSGLCTFQCSMFSTCVRVIVWHYLLQMLCRLPFCWLPVLMVAYQLSTRHYLNTAHSMVKVYRVPFIKMSGWFAHF